MSTIDPILPDRRLRLTVFAVAFVALALLAIEVRIRVLHRTGDWLVFWSAARSIHEPGDLYTRPAPTGDYYIYPPLFALSLAPLRNLPVENAVVIWHFVNIALLAGVYREWRRVVCTFGLERAPLWLTLSASLVATMSCVSAMQGGQLGVLILYFIVLGLRLALVDGAVVTAGMALAIPAVIKLSPGLAGAALVLQFLLAGRTRRALLLAASLALSATTYLFLLPSLLLGWSRNLALLTTFVDRIVLNQVSMHYESATNHGFVQLMRSWQVPGMLITTLAVGYGLVIAAAVVRLSLRGRTIDLVVASSLVCAASLFFSPVTWLHHFTLAMPFAAAAPVLLLGEGRQREAKLLSAAVLLVFLFQHTINYFESIELTILGALFPLVVVTFAAHTAVHAGRSAYESGFDSPPPS